MSSFEQTLNVIVRAAGIMEYIRANGEQSSQQIADHFSIARSTGQTALNLLIREKKLICYQKRRKIFGVNPAKIYTLGSDTTPVQIPVKTRKVRVDVDRCDISHTTVKAVQLGMKRDPLIAAFFGEARK